MSDDFMKDFDILCPPKRMAKIGGEEIDVTIVPARAALKFVDFSKKYEFNSIVEAKGYSNFSIDMLEDVVEVVAIVCKRSSQKITKDWLLDNVDIKLLMEFVQYVFAGMKREEAENSGDSEKNSISGT